MMRVFVDDDTVDTLGQNWFVLSDEYDDVVALLPSGINDEELAEQELFFKERIQLIVFAINNTLQSLDDYDEDTEDDLSEKVVMESES